MDLDLMYQNVVSDIGKGVSYQGIRKKYPLVTRNLYRKLGGVRSSQRELPDNNTVKLVTGGVIHDPSDTGPWDDELLVGSLMGDGNIEAVTDKTCLFKEGHCWSQIQYLAMKWEQFKPRSSGITLRKPPGGLSEHSICFTTVASKSLQPYRDAFYTAEVIGKKFLQKNTLVENIFERITPRAFAYWVMDDGKRYGSSRGCTCLTVATHPYHDLNNVRRLADILSDRVGFRVYWSVMSNIVEFRTRVDSLHAIIKYVAPYILPMFAYKLNLKENEVGEALRYCDWFKSWESRRHLAEHPFLELHPYTEYKISQDDLFKARYYRALLSQTIVQGFPYPILDENARMSSWEVVKEAVVTESAKSISCHPRVNRFPSSFMKHRYECRHKLRKSPVDIYNDRKALAKVLRKQLAFGPAVESTNIKNALSSYGTTALGQFNAGVARYFVEKYCRPGGVVLDPCAGWGNRLCGTIAAGRSYYGIEPSSKTYFALEQMRLWLRQVAPTCGVDLVHSVAEDESSYGGRLFDMAITSPPYFDVELYSDEETQSFKRYNTYHKWVSGFLLPFMLNTYKHLYPGSFFCVNVANVSGYSLESDTVSVASTAGFILEDTFRMPYYRRPGMVEGRTEPLFVFKKGISDDGQ